MCTMILGTPSDSEGSLAEDRLALIELKLDESQKTISAEREWVLKLQILTVLYRNRGSFTTRHFTWNLWNEPMVSFINEPRHDKTNKVRVCLAKTQTSLGLRPVRSESSLFAWRKFGPLATLSAHSEDSDQTSKQCRPWCPDLSVRRLRLMYIIYVYMYTCIYILQ